MDPRSRYRTWGGNHGKRLPRTCYPPGHPVHVVIRTLRGREVFRRPRLARAVFELVDRDPATRAACLMPDHLHWLIASDDFSRVVHRFKSFSTRVSWRTGHTGKLWQRSFYDHVVRRNEDLRVVAQYVLDNPVRAGRVREWREWPYSCLRLDRF